MKKETISKYAVAFSVLLVLIYSGLSIVKQNTYFFPLKASNFPSKTPWVPCDLPKPFTYIDTVIGVPGIHTRIFSVFKSKKANKLVVFCHGNGGNLSMRTGKALELLKLG